MSNQDISSISESRLNVKPSAMFLLPEPTTAWSTTKVNVQRSSLPGLSSKDASVGLVPSFTTPKSSPVQTRRDLSHYPTPSFPSPTRNSPVQTRRDPSQYPTPSISIAMNSPPTTTRREPSHNPTPSFSTPRNSPTSARKDPSHYPTPSFSTPRNSPPTSARKDPSHYPTPSFSTPRNSPLTTARKDPSHYPTPSFSTPRNSPPTMTRRDLSRVLISSPRSRTSLTASSNKEVYPVNESRSRSLESARDVDSSGGVSERPGQEAVPIFLVVFASFLLGLCGLLFVDTGFTMTGLCLEIMGLLLLITGSFYLLSVYASKKVPAIQELLSPHDVR